MNQKWLCIVCSLLLITGATACSRPRQESASQKKHSMGESSVSASKPEDDLQIFLANYSEQDMKDLFGIISTAALPNIPNATDANPYYGFQTTSELSSNGLFNFFCHNSDQTKFETYWNEKDQKYHVPVSFVEDTLNHYFEGYKFDANTINIDAFNYQAKEQCFVAAGFPGFDSRKDEVKIIATEQKEDGDIYITAKTLDLEDGTKETGTTEILVVHPTEQGLLFKSYQIVPEK